MESDTLRSAERDKEFDPVTAKINNQSNDKASINLSLESAADIYGVQFSIRYSIHRLNQTDGSLCMVTSLRPINFHMRLSTIYKSNFIEDFLCLTLKMVFN